MFHGFLAQASSFLTAMAPFLIQHEQLGFIFKTVLQFAHRAELVASGGNPGLVHVRKLNAAGVGGGLVRRQVDDNDSVGMAGEGGALIAHAVVFVGHLMNGAIDVEFLPVIGHLGEVMAEMDEDVAERLIGAQVLALVIEALDGHAGSGPETDLIELDPLDLGAAKEHRPHGSIADRQGFRHPRFRRPIIPQAQFSRGVRPGRVLLRRRSHARQWFKAQRGRRQGGGEQEVTPRNGILWCG